MPSSTISVRTAHTSQGILFTVARCRREGRSPRACRRAPPPANATRPRARHGRRRLAGRVEDRLRALDRLRERRVPVAEVEGLGRRERHVDAVEPGGGEALPAALVEDEARELDGFAAADALDHVLRGGHLRYAVGADEAYGLDTPQPGS